MKCWTLYLRAKHFSMECPGVFPGYVQVALGSYHFGKEGWYIIPGVITAIWLAIRDDKRSSYVIGSGVNSGISFGGKFLIALEPEPK